MRKFEGKKIQKENPQIDFYKNMFENDSNFYTPLAFLD